MRPPVLTWPVAAGSFVLGFAVADITGVRPLGGLVLLAGVLWCLPRWWRGAGAPAALGLTLTYLAAFVASHAFADVVGAYPSVLILGTAIGAACWALVDARAGVTRER
jgi:hypothetical protein